MLANICCLLFIFPPKLTILLAIRQAFCSLNLTTIHMFTPTPLLPSFCFYLLYLLFSLFCFVYIFSIFFFYLSFICNIRQIKSIHSLHPSLLEQIKKNAQPTSSPIPVSCSLRLLSFSFRCTFSCKSRCRRC